MSRWKGTQLNYARLALFDTETEVACCLTQQQAAILKAMLVPARWVTRWLNLELTQDALEALIDDIEYRLDGGDCELGMIDFRENPNDVCEVQYSKDGGVTWLTMFRKDTCQQPPSMTINNYDTLNQWIDTNTTNVTNYAGDITNVAPQWEYTAGYDDRALCYIIDKFVNLVCDFAINQIETGNTERRSENDWLDSFADFVAELCIEVIIFTTGIPAVPVAVAGAASWAALQIAEAAWDAFLTESPEYYQDEDAKHNIKCHMYLALRGETPQYTDWSTSLDDFEPQTPAETEVSETMIVWLNNIDLFIEYMMLMDDINSVAHLLPSCDCPMPTVIEQLAGSDWLNPENHGNAYCAPTDNDFGHPLDTPRVAPATYLPANQYYYGVGESGLGTAGNIRVSIPPNMIVTDVRVGFGGARPTGNTFGDRRCAIYLGEPGVDGVFIGEHTFGAGEYTDQHIVIDVHDIELTITTPKNHLYIHTSMDRTLGSAYIFYVRIAMIPYVP